MTPTLGAIPCHDNVSNISSSNREVRGVPEVLAAKRAAKSARKRAGVEGYPSEAQLLRLTEAAGIKLAHEPVPVPSCARPPAGVVITLPLAWNGPEGDRMLAHEAAHAVLCHGGGSLLRAIWPDCPRAERLARLHDQREEAEAREFVRRWFKRKGKKRAA